MIPRVRCDRAAAILIAAFILAAPAAQAELPVVELGVGMYRIEAELANTDQSRQVGLMNRPSMPAHRGMIFVFTQDARHCMWMKNTLIPLSVAFLDSGGRILNIERMQPRTEASHCAAAPARYALEMNADWFEGRKVGVGERIRGIDALPAGR
jgi:uncharacterized membrane protein (UPF0127 family)